MICWLSSTWVRVWYPPCQIVPPTAMWSNSQTFPWAYCKWAIDKYPRWDVSHHYFVGNLGSPGGLILYIHLPCHWWLIFFWPGSSDWDSFSPLLSFFTHQILHCLMSLQVQPVLHPPLICTSALRVALSLWHVIFVPVPPVMSRPSRVVHQLASSFFFFWHLSFILFLLFTWINWLHLILFKSLTVACPS